MPYPNEHAARLRDPDEFVRIVQLWEEDGIRALGGPLKDAPDGPTELQSLRFDADKWSVEDAKRWLEEHNYTPIAFEPAAEASPEASSTSTRPTVKILAYDGDVMRLSNYDHPTVIDLRGLNVTYPIPLLWEHDTQHVLGHVLEHRISTAGLEITARLSGPSEEVKRITESAKAGFPWRASVCVDPQSPENVEFIKAGKSITINGKLLRGPLYVVRRGSLEEVSIVAVPADKDTCAAVAASAIIRKCKSIKGARKMTQKQSFNPDAVEVLTAKWQADAERLFEQTDGLPASVVASIRSSAFERMLKLKEEAIANEMAPEIVEGKLNVLKANVELELIRATRPSSVPKPHRGDDQSLILEAALAASYKLPVERLYSKEVLEQADAYRNIGIQELLLTAARQRGYQGRATVQAGNLAEILQCAFTPIRATAKYSTVDVSGILSNLATKILDEGFRAVDQSWRAISRIKPVKDLKQYTAYRMGDTGVFEPVGPGGELAMGRLSEESYTVTPSTYGKYFVLTRQAIINDDLGAFDELRDRIGRGAGLALNTAFWGVFNNNSAFFTSARGNLLTGANSALSLTALGTATTAFRNLKDATGHFTGLTPKILLVPPQLEPLARQLYVSTEMRDTTSNTRYPTANIWQNQYKPVSSPYLQAANGGSDTAWYLLADPAEAAVMLTVFLNGQETPTVESVDTDPHTLGIVFRGYFDFGVTLAEWRAGVRCSGT